MTTLNDKPLLILDLDETLIHATHRPLQILSDFTVGPYFVYKRPLIDPFLESVAAVFRLAVWSSATDTYVANIVGKIIPSHYNLEFQWSQARCVQCFDPERQETNWVKDFKKLKRLGYDIRRVLIVDDSPEKLTRNYGNAVYVKPFCGDPTDRELERLRAYLVSVADCPDFRSLEKRNWRTG